MKIVSINFCIICLLTSWLSVFAQESNIIHFVMLPDQKQIDVLIGNEAFTSFLYPDSLEKPVLFPIKDASGISVTRGFPLSPKAGEPNDHPHHLGLWFNFENVNGLDFWNNSYAIPASKKALYGWIKTDKILEVKDGKRGVLAYHANWVNQKKEVLLEENTKFSFSATGNQRVIERTTKLTARIKVLFKDAKDGLLGHRLAHELQIPAVEDQKFTDNKGNVTLVKGGQDKLANGTYINSAGKTGDSVWSTRGVWCKVYAKMGADSVSVSIIDHPQNPNYPTFWHARGYGLFAANPLGEKIFTNGKSEKNLTLKAGESATFKYRIIISSGNKTPSAKNLDQLAAEFGKE